MNAFLLDVMHDLREKRLAPVAAVLLLALVAVPVLLLKGGSEPAGGTPIAETTPADSQTVPSVRVVEDGPGGDSDLGVFDPKDPFKPKVRAKKPSGNGVAQLVTPQTDKGTSASKGSGGSAPSAGASPAPNSGSTPSPTPAPRILAPTRVSYAYVADVTLKRNGHSRRIRHLHRLDMLPSDESPLLIFLGVTSDGDDAVFLVDSTLTTEGEGHCRPTAKHCATLSIGAGSEHEFIDPENNSFTLRINEIRKVRISKLASASGKKPRARTAVGAERRFVPPVLADILTVATPAPTDSSGAGTNR